MVVAASGALRVGTHWLTVSAGAISRLIPNITLVVRRRMRHAHADGNRRGGARRKQQENVRARPRERYEGWAESASRRRFTKINKNSATIVKMLLFNTNLEQDYPLFLKKKTFANVNSKFPVK